MGFDGHDSYTRNISKQQNTLFDFSFEMHMEQNILKSKMFSFLQRE